jgi:tetratricopeptide (TPR) repeat protein
MQTVLVLTWLLAVLSGAVVAQTNAPAGHGSVAVTNSTEKIEADYRALLKLDDDALTEVQEMIKRHNAQEGSGAPTRTEEELKKMIQFKLESVKKAYRQFLEANPQHVRAMIAYGSFLCDIEEESEGLQWWLKAREVDPKNAAVRNNLANHYGHSGEPKRAIEEYEAAIQLQPNEPVYYFNLANTLYLFRRDAAVLKNATEAEMLDQALESFRKARDLEPANLDYAIAYAETFYSLKNPNWQRALDAWEYCFKLNPTPLQRDQVYTHLARINIRLDNVPKAKEYLALVKTDQMQDLRERLTEIANQRDAASKISETLRADTAKAD